MKKILSLCRPVLALSLGGLAAIFPGGTVMISSEPFHIRRATDIEPLQRAIFTPTGSAPHRDLPTYRNEPFITPSSAMILATAPTTAPVQYAHAPFTQHDHPRE